MELALESDADDVMDGGDDWIFLAPQNKLFAVGAALQAKGYNPKSQQLVYHPSTTVTVSDPETAKSLIKLHDALDDYDDTQSVHANFEIADEVMAQLA